MEKYDALKLEKQLCFPLYAVSKEIVKKYKPYLDELDLTYTQYITMMVMWEHKEMNVKELGEHLYLDSGTLTPVLKKLEQKGWLFTGMLDTMKFNKDVKAAGKKSAPCHPPIATRDTIRADSYISHNNSRASNAAHCVSSSVW